MRWPTCGLILALALQSCDSYSLLGQFQMGGQALTLTAAQTTLVPNQTVALYPNGGQSPYSFGVVANNLASAGTLGTVTATPAQFTSGTSIGTVDVRVTDSVGSTAMVTVTVVPPAPDTLTGVYSASPPTNTLSWTYSGSTTAITGFQIWRSGGGTSTQIGTAGASALGYTDSSGVGSTVWTYTVYAYNGSFVSAASPTYVH